MTTILRTRFENYQGAGKLTCKGFRGPETANELVAACAASCRRTERAGERDT